MKKTAFMPDVNEQEVDNLIRCAGLNSIEGKRPYRDFLNCVYGCGIIMADRAIERLL